MNSYSQSVFVETLGYIPGVPRELRNKLSGLQVAHEHAATKRGQIKIQTLLKNYTAPRRDKQEFENEVEAMKKELEDDEISKEELRRVFKILTGSEVNFPPELKKQTVVSGKSKVDVKHGIVWGYNPYTKEKEKLEYSQKEEWKTFKERCMESVTVGDKQKLIPSLTVEKLITESERSGLSLVSLGRLARSFVEAEMPNVTSKISCLHDSDVAETFQVIESAIDVDAEIKMVQETMNSIRREPGRQDLADVVHNYLGKQIVLTQLRLGFANTDQEKKARITAAAEDTTMNALYNLVSPETSYYLVQDVQALYHLTDQKVTLKDMLKEAIIVEKDKPEWKIKTVMKPPSGLYATVQQGSINVVAEGHKNENEEAEEGILEDDEDFEDRAFVDYEGEVFLLSGVKAVQLRQSRQGKANTPGGHPSRRNYSPSPFKGKVTMMKRYGKSFGGGGPNRGSPGPRRGSPGPGRGGSSGGSRGPVWRRSGARGRTQYSARSPVRGQTPPRSPGRKTCMRCGSENHLGRSCPRYGKYSQTPCRLCKSKNKTLFHDPSVCLYSSEGGYKNPNSRSNSPNTKVKYGFLKSTYSRNGRSPTPPGRPKN